MMIPSAVIPARGPTEVHKWSLAKKIKRDHAASAAAA
jgi:hypothetical protein